MKRSFKYAILVLVIILLVPAITNAQTIKRNQKPKTEQTKKNNNSKRISKTRSKSQKSFNNSLSQTQKNNVIQQVTKDMVWVEGGTYVMGETDVNSKGHYSRGLPSHSVTVSGFFICKYEVTQALWIAVMGDNPSGFKGDLKRPVECVSWEDCQQFLSKLNSMTGVTFRLPSEAEWEYAARGGNKSKGFIHAGDNNVNSVAWYKDNSKGTTHAVGSKKPNELGLYDMNGNVCEWCQDRSEVYSSTCRMTRGGGIQFDAADCRVMTRGLFNQGAHDISNGLRLAASSL